MPLLWWQLWLASYGIKDCPLPSPIRERLAPAVGCPKGCRQQPCRKLSPGRVANSFAAVLARIGTPAPSPKQARKVPWLDFR
ncbi:hypothetical protein [uncultured Nostoc sp.]|uniref:hypothetical protein n=1 Tax=uncultured Nostoc sp. TaxID=340711 RepID=UPI002626FBCD|nr:hypothetical protein [uncultured Nostoc sp.]